MNSELDALQAEVGAWADAAFPTSTLDSIRLHFSEEAYELDTAVEDHISRPTAYHSIPEEAADCILILMHLAHRLNFSLDNAVRAKFAECQTRTWDSGEERGYSRHVADDDIASRLNYPDRGPVRRLQSSGKRVQERPEFWLPTEDDDDGAAEAANMEVGS
jgi:NTP pyrophosphatase (non-canonical NTP hydrolase)